MGHARLRVPRQPVAAQPELADTGGQTQPVEQRLRHVGGGPVGVTPWAGQRRRDLGQRLKQGLKSVAPATDATGITR